MLAPCRRLWRLWPLLLSCSLLFVLFLQWSGRDENTTQDSDREDWVSVRCEYVSSKFYHPHPYIISVTMRLVLEGSKKLSKGRGLRLDNFTNHPRFLETVSLVGLSNIERLTLKISQPTHGHEYLGDTSLLFRAAQMCPSRSTVSDGPPLFSSRQSHRAAEIAWAVFTGLNSLKTNVNQLRRKSNIFSPNCTAHLLALRGTPNLIRCFYVIATLQGPNGLRRHSCNRIWFMSSTSDAEVPTSSSVTLIISPVHLSVVCLVVPSVSSPIFHV
uniref:Uncharacterized protein n=1 Tax=Timema poppense TaxID=170557 RepID=A0A7R9GUV7_TIMPO|nr:unnamed protein product [Timema poppensis]